MFALGLILLLASTAQASVFDDVDISGHCRRQNTHIIENGDSLSVLFDDFGISLPAGQAAEGLQASKACNFRIRITFPRDQFLSGLRQVFSGGVVKSKGAGGFLNLNFMGLGGLGGRDLPEMEWKQGKAITPESPESTFTKVLDEVYPAPKACSGQATYRMRVALRAHRKSIAESFQGGLDSYDAELVQKLELVPRWSPCVRKNGKS